MSKPTTAARFHRWEDLPREKVTDLLDRRLICGERMMLAHVYLKKGCIVPKHSHHNEQITYIIEGQLDMVIDGVACSLTAGMYHIIPSNVLHSAVAATDCKVIDAFAPAREDYKS